MNTLIIQAAPTGNRLLINNLPRLASGSRNVVQIRLIYDLDANEKRWEEAEKTAVFFIDEETVYHVLVQDNIATVPKEVLAQEGHFFFGLMGVQGDQCITTEAVRLDVVQGAITIPTNVPAEPTPNIYEQLVEASAMMQARVNNLAKMKGTANETIYPLEGEHIVGGSIKVSGLSAAFSFIIDGLHLDAYGSYATDGCILPEITPLFPNDAAGTSQAYRGLIPIITDYPGLEAFIYPPMNEGDWAKLSFFNNSDQATEIYGAHFYGFYDLAAPHMSELGDVRVGAEGQLYDTAGEAVREQIKMIVDAGFDKEVIPTENYNLLKLDDVAFQSRLQNDAPEIISSNVSNAVTGWIPMEYGKFYTLSALIGGGRSTAQSNGTSALWSRINVKKADGTVLVNQGSTLIAGAASGSTIIANSADLVAFQAQLYFGSGTDISDETKMEDYEIMIVKGDTAEQAREKALTLDYVNGEAELPPEINYTMKEDASKADKEEVAALDGEVNTLKREVKNIAPTTAGQPYDGNFIPNERFIRSISNLRDTDKAKDIEISITNNSGKTIKNAAIVVGLHNTVGVNPADNNLPFQVYDDTFSEPFGFKFFDESGAELPHYIESESACNYIVDKNIKNDAKTMAVFSDGKIAVYNATAKRMQLTADDGLSWNNICANITSGPYRVLTPDSQDNLFVASSDGYRLYKYTAADGYQAGLQVIDMEADQTQIGSILAEDSDGNLYLGTYQSTPWRCVIRKSTDHGDTWSVVFDTTECQHVHNIFVNTKVTPNEIFIGLDNNSGKVQTHVSKDGGATWTKLDVPYRNNDNAFRYAGENFYIGCGERNILGGAALYKTSDYNDPKAYYTLFDNCQGIRDIVNVVDGSDEVLIAGGCVDDAVRVQHLFLSEDKGESWKTVLMSPHPVNEQPAGLGLRTFSRKGGQIISETSTKHAMRFVYGNGAKTILSVVSVGDIPTSGKKITLKTGYVASVEQMEKVLTAYEKIEGKVADIRICDGYVIDAVSNKRVMTQDTERVNTCTRLGQTSEVKVLADHAFRLNGSVNLGKLSRLNFKKGFTVSFLLQREKSQTEYLADDAYHVIFQSGDTKLILWHRSLVLLSGDTNIYAKQLYIEDAYLASEWPDYLRITATFSDASLPLAGIYTNNTNNPRDIACTEYPISSNLSANDFIVGNAIGAEYAEMPSIARIEIFNRVLSHGEVMALTNGCNLITDGSQFN